MPIPVPGIPALPLVIERARATINLHVACTEVLQLGLDPVQVVDTLSHAVESANARAEMIAYDSDQPSCIFAPGQYVSGQSWMCDCHQPNSATRTRCSVKHCCGNQRKDAQERQYQDQLLRLRFKAAHAAQEKPMPPPKPAVSFTENDCLNLLSQRTGLLEAAARLRYFVNPEILEMEFPTTILRP